MSKTLLRTKKTIFIAILFALITGWWFMLRGDSSPTKAALDLFGISYGTIALLGGIFGLFISKKWGGRKSIVGRAILMFSFGLLAQEFGQLAYGYYAIVKDVEVPYPSIGDLGYFGSVLFYIYGASLLAKASGVSFSLKTLGNKLQAIVIPTAILAVSYFIFLRGYEFDWSSPLTVFLDFGYPLGQAIYISITILAFLLSRKLLGGILRNRILFILFALAAQYAADFNFLYQSYHETWTTAGYGDYLYAVSYLLMTLSLLNFGQALTSMPAKTEADAGTTEGGVSND